MAFLYVAEFACRTINGVQVAIQPALREQKLAIGAATPSAAFGAGTELVRLQNDAVCSVLFGKNPTATIANARFESGSTEYFAVQIGDKLSVISNT